MDTVRTPVNIKRVAQEAGVSTMTISRVLNDPASVAPETRRRVQETIRRLGYRPNAIARSLKYKRTYTIGLITVDIMDHFFTQVSAGAEAEARQRGYRVMVSSSEHNPLNECETIRLLAEQRVDGILLVRDSIFLEHDPLENLRYADVPVVTTGYKRPGIAFSTVDIDNVEGGRTATTHLLENGHRRIAMISGPAQFKAAQDRSQGYQNALEAYAIPFDPDLMIRSTSWRSCDGMQAMQDLLQRDQSFTAAFIQSDELALGAIHILRQAGLRIPQDISVVSYDDIPVAAYFDPPLTTIRQPVREVGIQATRMLIDHIEEQDRTWEEVLLKTELIRRNSVIAI